jgi:hypothetical protein
MSFKCTFTELFTSTSTSEVSGHETGVFASGALSEIEKSGVGGTDGVRFAAASVVPQAPKREPSSATSRRWAGFTR